MNTNKTKMMRVVAVGNLTDGVSCAMCDCANSRDVTVLNNAVYTDLNLCDSCMFLMNSCRTD
jgi:hypothetical protein